MSDPVRDLLDGQIAYYRARAAEYDATSQPEGDPFAKHGAATVAAVERLIGGGRVLEIAAGTGQFTGVLAARADVLIASDASPEMLERNVAKTGDPRVRYEVADAFVLEPTHAYDAVFFGFFLSHVPRTGSTPSGTSWRGNCGPGAEPSSSTRDATACGTRTGSTRRPVSCVAR